MYPEILRRGGWSAEDNVSAPSSFIANEHNELYAFYTRKRRSAEKILRAIGGGRPHRSPPTFESATSVQCYHSSWITAYNWNMLSKLSPVTHSTANSSLSTALFQTRLLDIRVHSFFFFVLVTWQRRHLFCSIKTQNPFHVVPCTAGSPRFSLKRLQTTDRSIHKMCKMHSVYRKLTAISQITEPSEVPLTLSVEFRVNI